MPREVVWGRGGPGPTCAPVVPGRVPGGGGKASSARLPSLSPPHPGLPGDTGTIHTGPGSSESLSLPQLWSPGVEPLSSGRGPQGLAGRE